VIKYTTVEMGNISDVPAKGGGGGSPFRNVCPANEYLNEIHGESNQYVTKVCGKCSGGSELACQGKGGGTAYSYPGPFDFISVRAGDWIDQLYNSGGNGGTPYEMRCPAGHKVIGLYGRSGDLIDQLGAVCGAPIAQPVNNAVNHASTVHNPVPPANNAALPSNTGSPAYSSSTPSYTSANSELPKNNTQLQTNNNATYMFIVFVVVVFFGVFWVVRSRVQSNNYISMQNTPMQNTPMQSMPMQSMPMQSMPMQNTPM